MFSRREVLKCFAATPVLSRRLGAQAAATLSYRTLGRTGRWVTPLGLGGQGSVQWMPEGIDAVDIVVRALELGLNYLDTANAYGPGQWNYGQAFTRLSLIPGGSGYNAGLRDRLFIASKTRQRHAREAVEDLRTSLTTMFGDGQGYVPEGAYLDSMQIHQLDTMEEVDAVYEWLDRRGERPPDRIGAIAGLLDYRDGTNYTGLNPQRRHWIRHLGITGHSYSSVLMAALQRDTLHVIDTLLIALNANDRRYCAHQYNVVPLAVARGMGVIAMKAFADGAMYGRPARWVESAADVRLSVGAPGAAPPSDLVRYPLSVPGVATLVTGIGRIDRENPEADQLAVNLAAALSDVPSEFERRRIEDDVAARQGTDTNYFQARGGLTQPADVKAEQTGDRVQVRWTTALAGAEPLRSYRVYAGDRLVASLPFRPQLTTAPLAVTLPAAEIGPAPLRVEASPSLP